MSYIGILEYVIGVIHDKDIWYYVGDKDANGKCLRTDERILRSWSTPNAIPTKMSCGGN